MNTPRASWRTVAAIACTLSACTSDPVAIPVEPDASFAVETAAVGWTQLAARGAGPTAVNASAHAPELQAIFAAAMHDYAAGTLWRFDLRTDTWTQLTADNWPIGKFRRLIYDTPNRRLLTYWDGLGQVYAIPETGGSWAPVGSAGNSQDYYEGYAFFNPVTKRLSLFAGYGNFSFKNTLWEWNEPVNQWQAAAQSSNLPEARFGVRPSGVAIDIGGKRLFLGERSRGAQPGNYDDLWSLDLVTNTWRNLIPPTTGEAARLAGAIAWVPGTKTLYRFGGCTPISDPAICSVQTNELLSLKPDNPNIRWARVVVSGTKPSPRAIAGLFHDGPRSRLIVVSGNNSTGWQDDVWAYKLR